MKWTVFYKWLKGYKTSANSKGNYSKRCQSESTKTWAMSVLESCQTVPQVYTSLKLMELAGLTETDEYKVWSEFKALTKES